MVKSDRDHAIRLLEMASRDAVALDNMLDRKSFAEEVFGFHAQQAIEKALKAWIASLGREYPKTHDLSLLVNLIRRSGGDIDAFDGLEEFTVFAVQYRYEGYDEQDEPLDRSAAAVRIRALLSHVRERIAGKTA